MKSFKIIALISIAVLVACVTTAVNPAPEDRGKALFNDPMLGNGTSGRSCGTCHPDGKGLEGVSNADPTMINRCIGMALKGTPLDVESEQMKDLKSYINTIKPKADEVKKRRKAIVAC
jgi:hypothetical protein